MKAKSQGTLTPSQPRTKMDYTVQQSIMSSTAKGTYDQAHEKGKIGPQNNVFGNYKIEVPNLLEVEKFGGKRR